MQLITTTKEVAAFHIFLRCYFVHSKSNQATLSRDDPTTGWWPGSPAGKDLGPLPAWRADLAGRRTWRAPAADPPLQVGPSRLSVCVRHFMLGPVDGYLLPMYGRALWMELNCALARTNRTNRHSMYHVRAPKNLIDVQHSRHIPLFRANERARST